MANKTEQEACECSTRTRLVGDGCSICNPEYWADMLTEDDDLSATSVGEGVPTLDNYVSLSAVMYQVAGALNASVDVMDLLSAAQNQEPFSHMLDSALPYVVPPASAVAGFKARLVAVLRQRQSKYFAHAPQFWTFKELAEEIERGEFDN